MLYVDNGLIDMVIHISINMSWCWITCILQNIFFCYIPFFIRLNSLCFLNRDLHLAQSCVWNCLCWHNAAFDSRIESIRLLFSLGLLALYYETTDTRNMELNKISNEIVKEYMASSTRRETTSFLCLASPGADHLSDGRSRWVARGLMACAAAAGCSSDPQLSPPPTVGPWGPIQPRSLLGPMGRGRDARGDSFHECTNMPYAYLVMNESSIAWIGTERAGGQAGRNRAYGFKRAI